MLAEVIGLSICLVACCSRLDLCGMYASCFILYVVGGDYIHRMGMHYVNSGIWIVACISIWCDWLVIRFIQGFKARVKFRIAVSDELLVADLACFYGGFMGEWVVWLTHC